MTFAKSKQWTRPLKTAFYNRLVFRGHFFPAHVQVPLGGFRGDDSRPIRATIAFDFSLFRWVIRKFQKISRTLLMLLMLLNAFNTYRAVKPHMTTDLR